MIYSLPTEFEINGKTYKIKNKCDFRTVLQIIEILNDGSLSESERNIKAVRSFFENGDQIIDFQTAIKDMYDVINVNDGSGHNDEKSQSEDKVMDWKYDYKYYIPPVNKVLGYDVRDKNRYTHWWTFFAAYMEMGDCFFRQITSIREKLNKGERLEKWEQDFYRDNRNIIDLPSAEQDEKEAWLNGAW